MEGNEHAAAAMAHLSTLACSGRVTLLFATHDREHNHAQVLRDVILAA